MLSHETPGAWMSQYHREAPSKRHEPLTYTERIRHPRTGTYELWQSRTHDVSVRRFDKGFFVRNSRYIVLGISNADGSSRHDWREFQAIKNQLCGRDWEAIELYPAESRLKDPSNQFWLWCVPAGLLKFGLPGGRHVCASSEAIAPQRPFPEEESTHVE